MRTILSKITALLLALFALVTLFMSGSVLFDLFGIREKEGNYVLFVVIANFVCGLLYLAAVYGLLTQQPWTTRLLLVCVIILILTFSGLLWHIQSGGVYEEKTVKAMLFRITTTLIFTFLSRPRRAST